MNFDLSDEQKEICHIISKMSEKMNNDVFIHDEQAIFPKDKWNICANIGLFGLPIPERYGGMGCNMLTTALAIEAFSRGCQDEGLVFSCIAHMVTCIIPLYQHGSSEQKKKYLDKLITGMFIGGSGITEANAGSDFASLDTTVIENEDQSFLLNGRKTFVTNAPMADILIIYARHPSGLKMLNTSAFIIEKETDDYTIGQVFHKMGLRTSPISEVILDNTVLSPDRLLGRERLGMKIFKDTMTWERILISAYHVGAMEQQYEEVLAYANRRKQYGKKIIQFEGIYDKIIQMKIRLKNSKLMLYKVSFDYDKNKYTDADVSMLKLYTSESKAQNSLDAVQIFGAYGYMKESNVEKQMRDSLAAKIYSGTSEIQKLIIAKSLEE